MRLIAMLVQVIVVGNPHQETHLEFEIVVEDSRLGEKSTDSLLTENGAFTGRNVVLAASNKGEEAEEKLAAAVLPVVSAL